MSNREIDAFLERTGQDWTGFPKEKRPKSIKMVEIEEGEGLLLAEGMMAVKSTGRYLPFLQDTELLKSFARIVVDSGAVRFICNGADVMRPGIKSFESEFGTDQCVVVAEEKFGKNLAVGVSLMDSRRAYELQKGAVIRNLHYAGDRFWEAYKQLDK